MTLLLVQLVGGVVGGLLGQFVEISYRRRHGLQFDGPRAFIVVALSGICTVGYFTLFPVSEVSAVLFVHYGLFVTLAVEEFGGHGRGQTRGPDGEPVLAALAAQSASPAALVLDGFLPVSLVGAFGALLVELHALYAQRRKRLDVPGTYWVISGIMVVCGGAVTVLYGVTSVNALLALQIGASTSLMGKRLR